MGFDNLRPIRTELLPSWVPDAVQQYIAHTGAGLSIRDLARMQDCHASTISRRIRRIEQQRDDPLIDAALRRMEAKLNPEQPGFVGRIKRDLTDMNKPARVGQLNTFEQEALRVLSCARGRMGLPRARLWWRKRLRRISPCRAGSKPRGRGVCCVIP